MRSEVPSGWFPSTVGNCCDILDSERVPLNSEQRRVRQGNIPYWGANGVIDHIDDYIFDEPLLLLAEDGGYFDQAHTRPICHLVNGKSWVNNHAHVMRVRSENLREYVYYWFVHRDITRFINSGTRSKLNQADLRKLPLLLPPLPEQKKIAAILSSVDEAIQATQAVIDQTRKVKEGLLQDLLTRGIGHTRFKQTEIGEIPEGWEATKLGEVAEVRSGIAKNTKRALVDPREVAYLRVANVQDGFVDLTEIKSILVERREVPRYSLRAGDVLMTEGGDIDKLGRGDVWAGQIDPCVHQNHVFSVRCGPRLRPRHLSYLAESPFGKAYFLAKGKQTTNLASINKTQLQAFPVPLPSIDEQDRVVERLDSVRAVVEQARSEVGRLRTLKAGLLQDLLAGKVRVSA